MGYSVLSFDIGGTAIRAATSVDGAEPGEVSRTATPAHDREAFLACLADMAARLPQRPDAISISLAGVVDPQTGRMIVANIPAIHGTDLAADLKARTGMPVIITNDADCFAVAEAVFGAGRQHDIVFGIILGTGVGGGLVSGRRLINAKGGFAGEWGHGPIAPARANGLSLPPFACGCGLSGCLDTVASARGLERLHAHFSGQTRDSRQILDGWRKGEAAAAQTVGAYLDLIAGPLAVCVNLTGATIVPAGGGLSAAHDLLDAIDRAVRPLTLRNFDRPLVVPAMSGPEPGLAGASAIAWQQHQSS
ncbi:ROK family protein [Martelella limonii]|uniref:ROK family protein n=1 Tax=Martelella limonii TaxID=1647649 RepID=UPI0031403585